MAWIIQNTKRRNLLLEQIYDKCVAALISVAERTRLAEGADIGGKRRHFFVFSGYPQKRALVPK